MKRSLLLCAILFVAQLGVAQRNPSHEILVYFKEGVLQEKKTEKGTTIIRQTIKSDLLKSKLEAIAISEDMLEVAMPSFDEADTMRTLPTGEIVPMLNMAKLCRIKIKTGQSKKALIEKLNALPEVLYAEPNVIAKPLATPSDELFDVQWNLKNTVTAGEDIHAEAAWDIYTGNPNNIIGIIDGGIEVSHVDLNDKVAGGDTGYGWDEHGIHVAGIAAAETNNGTEGIAGVDWHAKIHPQRIDNVDGDAVDIYQAIVNAVDYSSNLHVLNHSWNLRDENQNVGPNSITIRHAFAYAYKANRTSVVGMGNHQGTQPNEVAYPAGFENVITVGSTNIFGAISGTSAQGSHIDVVAPGVGIMSTLAGSYGSMSGTSMAAPHVSGIASLLKGYKPNLANDDIENIIKLSSDDKGDIGFDNTFGHGRVNAESALNLFQAPNQLFQWSATTGTVHSTTGNYTQQFLSAPGIATGTYIVKRKEVRKSVTFPTALCQLIGVWGRGVGSTGWSLINPNFGEGFVEVVPGTASNTGVTLRTYVYEVTSVLGQPLGHYPTTPGNVTFNYTVLGVTFGSVTGPSFVCTTNTNITLSNAPTGASVTWAVTPTSLFGTTSGASTSGSGASATVRALNNWSSGQATITFTVTSSCGGPVNVQKTFWVGGPAAQGIDISNVYDPMTLCPYTEYIVEAYGFAGGGPITEYEWLIPSGWTSVQGGSQNPFTHNDALVQLTTTASGPGFIRVRAKNDACGYGPPFFLSVDTECQMGGLAVYPNPAHDELHIAFGNSSKNETVKLLIYDDQNIKRYEREILNHETVSVADLKEGVYYIHILNKDGIHRKRLVIKKSK
ncbi:MAG: T9SS type A sorting domain-containing protein [Cyclobacteriaceae bacterium]|nr:MAG: T9SS type A sorting domain-containing protein [Cyclobacteriaceae bacterium]